MSTIIQKDFQVPKFKKVLNSKKTVFIGTSNRKNFSSKEKLNFSSANNFYLGYSNPLKTVLKTSKKYFF